LKLFVGAVLPVVVTVSVLLAVMLPWRLTGRTLGLC
jgi:hypothetical protein